MDKAPWTIRSNTGKNQLVGIFSVLLGIPFVLLTVHHLKSNTNALAGFGVGILLIGIGVVALLFTEEITVIVDPGRQRLMIQRGSRLGQKLSIVNFNEIASVLVGSAGGYRGPKSYHLKISLRNGKTATTGRWSLDQSEIIALAEQLAAEIGCTSDLGILVNPVNASQIIYSVCGAVILYAIWFRIWVGPWCLAMWFGTAPPVIMLIVFSGMLGVMRRIPRR